MAKKILKWVGVCIALILLAAAGLVAWLTAREYRPDAIENAEVFEAGRRPVAVGSTLTVLSQNTGYAALGRDADFFMDGGRSVQSPKDQVSANLTGLADQLAEQAADVYFLQEVDTDSTRSYSLDQRSWYHRTLNSSGNGPYSGAFALNYSCDFVPYPLPPIGKVHSGLQTVSAFSISSAQRIALPCPFSWPVSAANLKRCLLVCYVPLESSEKQLVLVNLHLEAYDDGAGKTAQTEMLMDFLSAEYEKGNYVIAGGDFNQIFPGALDVFPIKDSSPWAPGVLEADILPSGWRFACDLAVPSCRLLNQPYDPDSERTQFYVIDGFILSPNVRLDSVETVDRQFQYADHNPVAIQVTLERSAT